MPSVLCPVCIYIYNEQRPAISKRWNRAPLLRRRLALLACFACNTDRSPLWNLVLLGWQLTCENRTLGITMTVVRGGPLAAFAAALLCIGPATALHAPGLLRVLAPAAGAADSSVPAPPADSRIKAYNLSVPVDHFHNSSRYEPHSNATFPLRYWLDTSNYRPGGPVVVLNSGEFTSEGRFDFLDHGIVPILTKATGGVGVVLEHRYYGTSYPTEDVSVENLRFLSTEQALADNAYFARHVRFPGLEHVNLTAPGTPWIIYGGSYAGAVAAFTRKVYPDVYWGAISSSGVTAAVDVFWQYFEAARHYAPGDCSPTQQKLMHVVDSMLLSGDDAQADKVKDFFGLKELWNDEFAAYLTGGVSGLQSTNWDPAEDDASFGKWCATITSNSLLFESTAFLRPEVEKAVGGAGYKGHELKTLTTRMLNYIGFVKDSVKQTKSSCKGQGLRECVSDRFYTNDTSIAAGEYRSWLYQTCTEYVLFSLTLFLVMALQFTDPRCLDGVTSTPAPPRPRTSSP